ncbi:MAG: P-II family nitrogen regulator [Coriobacteriales bacterium]|jgi:nitrogen regulatory protein PII 2|nr:P-II family nitrogen regulator [Coriobacteriales bacterium]
MKEILAIVRGQKVNATKDALADAGFPAFYASKVLGRGKKHIGELQAAGLLTGEELPRDVVGESVTEVIRLVSKRMVTIIVDDADAKKAIDVVIAANQTGQPGDGKIFVLPIDESYRVRDRVRVETAV